MKPNCMICNRLLKLNCPLFHPLRDFNSNFPMFWDTFSKIVKDSAVVCILYEKTKDEKGDDK